MAELTPLDMIQLNAKLVIDSTYKQFGVTLSYDAESVEWLDEYIERLRAQKYPDDDIDKLINVFGSYLGECIRREFGGEWVDEQGSWLIRFDDKNAVYPFSKVLKQFKSGPNAGESIASFYNSIPRLFPNLRKDSKS